MIYAVTGSTKSALRDTTASTGKLILFCNLPVSMSIFGALCDELKCELEAHIVTSPWSICTEKYVHVVYIYLHMI